MSDSEINKVLDSLPIRIKYLEDEIYRLKKWLMASRIMNTEAELLGSAFFYCI